MRSAACGSTGCGWCATVSQKLVPVFTSQELTRLERACAGRSFAQHPWWSAFWDKEYGVWRVAEDDPDSALYAESADAAEVLSYMAAHS